jgi:hypothetical protein
MLSRHSWEISQGGEEALLDDYGAGLFESHGQGVEMAVRKPVQLAAATRRNPQETT